MKFEGVITAIVSPFHEGRIDVSGFKTILHKQSQAGVSSFVINGTTGESPCLDWEEVELLYRIAREELGGAFPLILGTGSNSTKEAVELTQKAKALGAQGVLSVVPYYNKPTQEGMYRHFQAIAASADIPVLLYNIPGRSIVSMSLETMQRLSKIPNIVGIKEASGDPELMIAIKKAIPHWSVLGGDDDSFLSAVLGSCDGVISVISHVIPGRLSAWTKRAQAGDATVLAEFAEYKKLCSLLFREPNPSPVKYVLMKMAQIASDETRLPLVECSSSLKRDLDHEMEILGL